MKLHRNAKTTPTCAPCSSTGFGTSSGRPPRRRPPRASACARPTSGWGGIASAARPALEDASSRPHRQPRRTSADDGAAIVAARYERRTAWAIAVQLQVPRSTVAAVLVRVGLNRLARLTPPRPGHPLRMARARASWSISTSSRSRASAGVGHRIHGDRRRASRASAGSTRTSRSMTTVGRPTSRSCRIKPAPRRRRSCGGPSRWFARRGVRVARVLTDNGSDYRSRRFQARGRAPRRSA